MKRRRDLIFLLLLTALACGFLLFYRLDALPLRLWDEGRRAVNALEMWTGDAHFLVPTFLGEPEHWGTKPPVLIWLQTLAMKLFGPTVMSVRLPAAVATLFTGLFLTWFAAARLQRFWAGMVAALALVTAPFFMDMHAARAGDFDAVLVLFSTVGVLGFYQYLRKRDHRFLLLASIGLLLSLWTKGVAALFFLPGIFLLCLLVPDYRHAWTNWRVYAAVLVPLLSLVGYYLVRDSYDPGFLQLLWENELGGRFSEPLEGHRGGPGFYLRQLLFSPTEQRWWLCLVVAPLLYWRRPQDRPLIRYLSVLLGTHLLILSLASTKLLWYAMPQIPLYCLLLGLGFQAVVDRWSRKINGPYRFWSAVVGVVLLFAWPYAQMTQYVARTQHGPEYGSKTAYENYLPGLDALSTYTVLLPSYNPAAIFHAALARHRGTEVQLAFIRTPEDFVVPDAAPITLFPLETAVVVCEQSTWAYMNERYRFRSAYEIAPCKLLYVDGYETRRDED